jgi:hypothetical protein
MKERNNSVTNPHLDLLFELEQRIERINKRR